MAALLLWIADACWWVVCRLTGDLTIMQIRIDLFVGSPDAMGSYEVATLRREYGPKAR